MGTQYRGLSSLFSSILNILSLAELGFGDALVYSMYKPIAENDTGTICALMKLYKKIYRIVGAFILIMGLTILPFIRHLVHGEVPSDINLYTLFIIYLFNTVASYFLFAYKNSLLLAFQRYDISTNVGTILTTLEYGIQIILVLILKNYYCYVIVFPVFTIIGNFIRARIVSKKYPQYTAKGELSKIQKMDIYKKTLALACHKFGNTISTSLDSMIVSACLGLNLVAIFGNYNYIVSSVMSIIWIIYYSMVAGIGNRMNLLSLNDNYEDFRALTSLNNFIVSWATSCLLFLYQPFIKLWTGENNMLGLSSVIIFSLYFYVYQSRKIVLLYKDAAGLWREDQWKPIAGAIFNLFLNVILVQAIGINGVIVSSILSFLIIEIPWEVVVLYKYYFKKRISEYIVLEIKAFIICLPIWCLLWGVCKQIEFEPMLTFVLRGIICVILPLPYLYTIYNRNKDFMRILNKIGTL